MKIHLIKIVMLALVFTAFSGCGNAPDHKKTETAKQNKQAKNAKHYTCTMHPEIDTDKPGTCAKCGMDLIEKEN